MWCVRRPSNDEVESADGWWCCFAHYGAQNHRTVLIEYSNEGDGFDREVRRFTFPRSVIDDFDQMSASGGIWDGDTLLVSHHHFKVIYRLAIPEQGSELRLVEVLGCPFPGRESPTIQSAADLWESIVKSGPWSLHGQSGDEGVHQVGRRQNTEGVS